MEAFRGPNLCHIPFFYPISNIKKKNKNKKIREKRDKNNEELNNIKEYYIDEKKKRNIQAKLKIIERELLQNKIK
jgi:hypothetical protein